MAVGWGERTMKSIIITAKSFYVCFVFVALFSLISSLPLSHFLEAFLSLSPSHSLPPPTLFILLLILRKLVQKWSQLMQKKDCIQRLWTASSASRYMCWEMNGNKLENGGERERKYLWNICILYSIRHINPRNAFYFMMCSDSLCIWNMIEVTYSSRHYVTNESEWTGEQVIRDDVACETTTITLDIVVE